SNVPKTLVKSPLNVGTPTLGSESDETSYSSPMKSGTMVGLKLPGYRCGGEVTALSTVVAMTASVESTAKRSPPPGVTNAPVAGSYCGSESSETSSGCTTPLLVPGPVNNGLVMLSQRTPINELKGD